jgi:hypothetical protein
MCVQFTQSVPVVHKNITLPAELRYEPFWALIRHCELWHGSRYQTN